MKKMPIILSMTGFAWVCAFGIAQAQDSQQRPENQQKPEARILEVKAAVKEGKSLEIGHLMDRELYPEGVAQLQWYQNAKSTTYFYAQGDSLMLASLKGDASLLFSKDQLAQDPAIGESLHYLPYILKAENNRLFMLYGSDILVYNLADKKIESRNSLPESGNWDIAGKSGNIAYTVTNNLYVRAAEATESMAVSNYPDTGVVVGANDVHRNEFGIYKGTFWSNQGDKLAYYWMDESMVQLYPILNYLQDPTQVNNIRYPEAGRAMHEVKVGVFDVATGKNLYLEAFADPSHTYIPSVTWNPDGSEIYAVILDRNQKDLSMVCYDAATGEIKRTVFEEHNDIYVEPEANPVFRPGHPDQFLWFSERKGYNHIYLYNTDGECLKAVTPDNEPWMVTSFVGFSPDGNTAYYTSTQESPLQNNLYSVNLNSGKILRLTKADGSHSIQMHPSGKYFIDVYGSSEMGRKTQIIDNKGKVVKVLKEDNDPLDGYITPEFRLLSLKSADGKTDLYGRMILPPDFDSTRKYPVLVYVYGGPHAQLITESYNYGCGHFLRFMAQQGYIVWTLDNRGSANRGFAFETATHRHLGDAETADQMQGIAYLKSLPYVDAERIGVDGWSFGGFMTLTLKTRYPDVFKVATAGGPVINWAWYEIMYGERYMGTPQDNPEGYEKANLLNRVDSIRGKVMLLQGGLDPVVTPKNSTTFVQSCIQKNIPVDFFVYPNHEHNVIGPQRDHLFQKWYEYYQQNL